MGTEHYIQENTDSNVEKVNKEQLIRSIANSRQFNETFTNLFNKMENILQRQNITVHHLNDANQLMRALQHYKKQKPEDIAELAQMSETPDQITENIDDKREKLAELKKKLKEVNKRFSNSRGEGDSRNNHLQRKELWHEIDKLEAEIKAGGRDTPTDTEILNSIKERKNIIENNINNSMEILPNPVIPKGTEIYLEGLITEKADLPKESKPKEKFEPIQKNKAGIDNKTPFIPHSGPESEGNGFKADKIAHGAKGEDNIEEPNEFSQGTEKYLPKSDEIPGPGPKTDHEDNSADNVNGFTDFNTKQTIDPIKKPAIKLNNPKKKLVNESRYTRAASTNEQEEAISEIEHCLKKLGKNIVGGTTIGKSPQTVILDLTYQGGEITVNSGGWEDEYGVKVNGQEVNNIQEFRDVILGKPLVNKIEDEEPEGFPGTPPTAILPNTDLQESKKIETTRLNNYNNTLMQKIIKDTNTKSEFDRLCEDVLGPEEVELGIDENPKTGEVDTNIETGEVNECPECSPADKIRNAITELEAVLAELEGTSDVPLDDGTSAGKDTSVETGNDLTGDSVKESAMTDDNTGVLKNQKEVGATSVKGRANIVSGDASDIISGEGDGTIENKDRSGKLEKAKDGVATMNGKPSKSNIEVNSKIKGKNQKFFNVK